MRLLKTCPLCGALRLEELFYAKDPHYGIPGSHRVVRCSACALVFLNPMHSDEELAGLYPPDYYAYTDPPSIGFWKIAAKKLLGFWQGTKEPRFECPGVFLDIGCGSGAFVCHMRDEGWNAYGVEINPATAKAGCKKGLNIREGALDQANLPSAFFDYIRASHSLEHMSDPGAALDEMHRLLKPGARLLIAVPNIAGLSARVFKRYWWHLCPGVHTFSFSSETLTRLLQQHSFLVEQLTFNSDYVGILGSLQIWLNRRGQEKSSQGYVFNSRPLRELCTWLQCICDALGYGDMIEVTAAKIDGT